MKATAWPALIVGLPSTTGFHWTVAIGEAWGVFAQRAVAFSLAVGLAPVGLLELADGLVPEQAASANAKLAVQKTTKRDGAHE